MLTKTENWNPTRGHKYLILAITTQMVLKESCLSLREFAVLQTTVVQIDETTPSRWNEEVKLLKHCRILLARF